jgi:uncharacterized protein
MSRIRRAFRRRFEEILGEFGARDRIKGVELLFAKAGPPAAREFNGRLTAINVDLAHKLHRLRSRRGMPPATKRLLLCDAGLGGLARWLRASGIEAEWMRDIDDGYLLDTARQKSAIVVTTDNYLLDRRLVTGGLVYAIWVPPTLRPADQLELVLAELGVEVEPSRCMACGGELREVEKEEVKDRIPSRTYRWLDEFFECTRCGKLYWEGTHWQRIANLLPRS